MSLEAEFKKIRFSRHPRLSGFTLVIRLVLFQLIQSDAVLQVYWEIRFLLETQQDRDWSDQDLIIIDHLLVYKHLFHSFVHISASTLYISTESLQAGR